MIGGIILAAGGSSRFGGRKQLAELDGRPLVEHAVEALRAVPSLDRIVVVLGADAEDVRRGADLSGTKIVVADDWSEGIAASLRTGVATLAAAGADAALVALADQPFVGPEAVEAVLTRRDDPAPAVRATYSGVPGHPVLFKRELFEEIARLRGDHGARELLERRGVIAVECGDLARADDVDTQADLEALRSR